MDETLGLLRCRGVVLCIDSAAAPLICHLLDVLRGYRM